MDEREPTLISQKDPTHLSTHYTMPRCVSKLFLSLSAIAVAFLVRLNINVASNRRLLSSSAKEGYAWDVNLPIVVPPRPPPNSDNKTAIVIFYNMFVPLHNNTKNAIEIVKEQIEQIGASFNNSATYQAWLYYVSIEYSLPDSFVQDICARFDNLVCKRLRHYTKGYEERTLSLLWNYCKANPDQRVVYVHNKGSFHPNEDPEVDQNEWRRAGTSAAIDDLCLQPPDRKCDFCGLLATPMPWLHVSKDIPYKFCWTFTCYLPCL
jgi:hypothetical protein